MTYNECVELSKQCKSKTEFARTFYTAYQYAKQNDFLNVLYPSTIKWTYETCKNEALKYKTRSAFGRWSSSAYKYAQKNKLLDDFFGTNTTKPNGYWTYERCLEESKKYTCRKDFFLYSPSAYNKSKNKQWLKDFEWLKTPIIAIHTNETKNIIYSYEDTENKVVYVGRTINLKKRHSQHNSLNNKTKKYDVVKQYFLNLNQDLPNPKILEETETYYQSQEKEGLWVEKYKQLGWTILNIAKTGAHSSSIGGGYIKWTYEKCLEESKKYATRMEFKQNCSAAYSAALRYNWLDSFNFKEITKPFKYWYNKDNCFAEMRKYTLKKDFIKNSQSAYHVALKMGWVDEFYGIKKP